MYKFYRQWNLTKRNHAHRNLAHIILRWHCAFGVPIRGFRRSQVRITHETNQTHEQATWGMERTNGIVRGMSLGLVNLFEIYQRLYPEIFGGRTGIDRPYVGRKVMLRRTRKWKGSYPLVDLLSGEHIGGWPIPWALAYVVCWYVNCDMGSMFAALKDPRNLLRTK